MRKKCIEHADELSRIGNHNGAINYYRQAMEIDSADASLNYSLGLSYMRINSYQKAFHYFVQCGKYDRSRQYTLSYHFAGEMDKILGNYPSSLKWHRRFVRRFKGDRSQYEYLKSQYELDNIRLTGKVMKKESDLVLTNDHPVNTTVSEFAPFFESSHSLLFSSLRSDSSKGKRVMDTASYYTRIYRSVENEERWKPGVKVDEVQLEPGFHAANAALTPSGDYVYFSQCNGTGTCVIQRAKLDGEDWVNIEVLPEKINLPGCNNTQPSLARIDGFDILFFVSDRKGGRGRMDIWSCIAYSNGLYSDPVNLGDSINSPGNELSPFYMAGEGALYFSSDYYAGLGAFDVFRSASIGEGYHAPENLGRPINSTYNDLYFRSGQGRGVLSSNREGSLTDEVENCCSDLFFFDYKAEEIKKEVELSNIEKIERLLPVKLFFENDEPNPRSNDTATSILYSASFVNYKARLSAYEREYSRGMKGEEKEAAALEIKNFFEYEIIPSYEDLREALHLLEGELKKGSHLKLEIKGYASPLSSSDYNRKLTLRRISSVKNEIEHFNGSSLLPFLSNGQLQIALYPFGEDQSAAEVSDDLNDRRNAIYSKRAAFERRVEIISIEFQ